MHLSKLFSKELHHIKIHTLNLLSMNACQYASQEKYQNINTSNFPSEHLTFTQLFDATYLLRFPNLTSLASKNYKKRVSEKLDKSVFNMEDLHRKLPALTVSIPPCKYSPFLLVSYLMNTLFVSICFSVFLILTIIYF